MGQESISGLVNEKSSRFGLTLEMGGVLKGERVMQKYGTRSPFREIPDSC